jgi:hypothetical protein
MQCAVFRLLLRVAKHTLHSNWNSNRYKELLNVLHSVGSSQLHTIRILSDP